jgi:hypothetical protein
MGLEAPRLLDYSIIQSGIREAERYHGRGLQLIWSSPFHMGRNNLVESMLT